MLRLPEEVRLVRRNGVDKVLALFFVRRSEEIFAILFDRLQPEVANAAQKTALYQRELRFGHFYAELVGNVTSEAREARGREIHRVGGFS